MVADEIGFIGFNSIPPSGSLPDINFGIPVVVVVFVVSTTVAGLEIGFKGCSNLRISLSASLFLVAVVVDVVVGISIGVVIKGTGTLTMVGDNENVTLIELAHMKALSFAIYIPSSWLEEEDSESVSLVDSGSMNDIMPGHYKPFPIHNHE